MRVYLPIGHLLSHWGCHVHLSLKHLTKQPSVSCLSGEIRIRFHTQAPIHPFSRTLYINRLELPRSSDALRPLLYFCAIFPVIPTLH
ncbi:hypothetical protein J5N97_008354 [Dioscorea zingiberensis]|uniref:Uncharacterized protein n=1 Tax=Dioscorea zingiberensis TaxID=325984 RepID=A0A9D5CWC6_9LILI|nr:hypothetical protein J5N97_008354 [Dioscorea zingiberensis]